MSDPLERKLAAIVAADVEGYSRLIGLDESATIRAVRDLLQGVVEPLVRDHGGRVVKTMGDGFLIEFASAVAGVEAAVAIQQRLGAAEPGGPGGAPLRLRIGIHVGDVVFRDGDIFGEGVNIAARIEPLAEPGGIGISDDTWRQVRDRVALAWTDGGERTVKNIARPVRIWHWHRDGAAPGPAPAPDALPLPDKPSVAVLPFDTMSGGGDQDGFADGMTEDLITDLSKVSGLFVVARNSTFAYRGQVVDIAAAAKKLGVRHVVEGSVRKAGTRVRINVQLIDAATGGHVWADRYDGSLEDVFELQDQVCHKVVEALSVRLTAQERDLIGQVHTRNVEAYELFVRAKATPYPPIPERIEAARKMFAEVIEMAPDFAGGYAGLSWLAGFRALWGHGGALETGREAEDLAHRAIAVDGSFGWAYTALGVALFTQRRYAEAVAASEKSLALLPNDADAHAFHALILGHAGDRTTALGEIERAIRLNPHFVNGPYMNLRSQIRLLDGDCPGAIASHEENLARGGPVGPPAYCWAAAAYNAVGDTAAAARNVAELAARFPGFRLAGWNYLDLVGSADDSDRMRAMMLAAGIPG